MAFSITIFSITMKNVTSRTTVENVTHTKRHSA
jgi:hypothetical protein